MEVSAKMSGKLCIQVTYPMPTLSVFPSFQNIKEMKDYYESINCPPETIRVVKYAINCGAKIENTTYYRVDAYATTRFKFSSEESFNKFWKKFE